MPTPVKYYNEQVRDAYRTVEESACRTIVSMLPENLRDEYMPFFLPQEADAPLWRFVKAADKISALTKCIAERQAGNLEFEQAAASTLDAIRKMQKEEQKLRKQQAAATNETLSLSLKMLSDNLAQNQSQTRETTAAQLRQFEERIRGLESANSRSMAQLQDTVMQQMELLRAQNDKRLTEIRKTVDDTLQTHLEQKMTESFKRVTDSLEAVYKGLGEMQTLASDVGGLKRVLSNVKTRGTLGEIRLGSILQEIMAPEQYDTNVETVPGSGKRVEFAIRLPAESG